MLGDPVPETPTLEEEDIFHGVRLLQSHHTVQFLRWVDVNDTLRVVDVCGNTLLHWAAALGDLRVVTHLIEEGLDIDTRNGIGSTPLLCAAASCRNPGAIIDCLIRRGANTDVVNLRNETMKSLLDQRNLHPLSQLFLSLKSAMEGCPKLFTSSGAGKRDGVGFEQRANLGSSEVLAKLNNTVRFKKDGEEFSGTETMLSTSSGSPYLGGLYNVYSPTGSVTEGGACSMSCPARQRLLDRELRLCVVEEERGRYKLLSEYWVGLFFMTYEGTAPLGTDLPLYEDEEDYLVDNVARVLGERFADGQRWILVQWFDEDGVPMPEGYEEWVTLPQVKHCQAVCAYFLSYEQTAGSSMLTMENSSMQSSQTPRVMLDPREREELEMELRKIAQRKLESPCASFRPTPREPSPQELTGSSFQKISFPAPSNSCSVSYNISSELKAGQRHSLEAKNSDFTPGGSRQPMETPLANDASFPNVPPPPNMSEIVRLNSPVPVKPAVETYNEAIDVVPCDGSLEEENFNECEDNNNISSSPSLKNSVVCKPTFVDDTTPTPEQKFLRSLPPLPMNHYNAKLTVESLRKLEKRPTKEEDIEEKMLAKSSEAWKNRSFNTTASSTNSDIPIPSLSEIAMKGGYKPLSRRSEGSPPQTSGTRVFDSKFMRDDDGYNPMNLRPQYKRGHILLSERQKNQYKHLHQEQDQHSPAADSKNRMLRLE